MRECLREVAEMLPAWTNLLRVQSEVVSVSQKFLEQKLRLFQFSSACKTFDIPKGACSETAFSARNSVYVRALRIIATNQGIFD